MTTIAPCLWFDDALEEAAAFYTSIFPDARVGRLTRRGDGSVLAGEFTLAGTTFRAINGGPQYAGFTPTISFAVDCADQAEADYYWDSLVDGGQESMCGWLVDRFGLSWQIVPARLYELLTDPHPLRAAAASRSMLAMQRIVIADLEAAADAAGH